MYKLVSVVHKCLLLIIFVIPFIAKILVGAAGHNNNFSITDYLWFAYLIVTAVFYHCFNMLPEMKP